MSLSVRVSVNEVKRRAKVLPWGRWPCGNESFSKFALAGRGKWSVRVSVISDHLPAHFTNKWYLLKTN